MIWDEMQSSEKKNGKTVCHSRKRTNAPIRPNFKTNEQLHRLPAKISQKNCKITYHCEPRIEKGKCQQRMTSKCSKNGNNNPNNINANPIYHKSQNW